MDKKYELYQYFTDITKTQKRPLKSTMIVIDIENECVVAALNELNEPVPSDFYIPNPNEQFYNKFNDFLFGECSAEEVENCRKACSTKLLLDTETNEIEMKNITKQHDTQNNEIEMNEMLKQTKAEPDEIEMNNTKQFDTENNEVKIDTIVEQIKAETDEIEMNDTKQFDTRNYELKIDTITKHFENNEFEMIELTKQTEYILSKESEYNPYKYTYDVPFVKNKRLIHDLPYYYHNRFTYLDDHTILPVQPKFVATEYKSRTIFYDWEGPVPTDPIAPYTDSPAIRYIKSILDDYPVIGQKHISLSVDEYHKATGNTIKITNLKKSLPFLCYYMKNGPFAKCWIKFGYDPRLDKNCYKYQRIMKYKLNNKTNFIFEDPKLLAEIERNRNSLLRATFCNNQGWFREELINYMKSYFKKKSLQKLTS